MLPLVTINWHILYNGIKITANIVHKILSCVQRMNNNSWEDNNFNFLDFYEFKFSATLFH